MANRRSRSSEEAFFALLRAGLWENPVAFEGPVDFAEVYRIAEEQSVVGLVAAALEHIQGVQVPPEASMRFIKNVLAAEKRNADMNAFIEKLSAELKGVDFLLVKGQGVAQCYERPLWRAAGDVDLLLSADNYEKAKAVLIPKADFLEEETLEKLHFGMGFGPWIVELHGTLHNSLSKKVNDTIDEVQRDGFDNGKNRIWHDGKTDIRLPSVDDDVIFVFTHVLQHFFRGGVGLRQICDWCRLMWTYRESLDHVLLKKRIDAMNLIDEWQVFASYAVNYLGMPVEAMPFLSDKNNNRKLRRLNRFILQIGNFGHNKDASYRLKCSYILRKSISLWRHFTYIFKIFPIFPKNTLRAFMGTFRLGMSSVLQQSQLISLPNQTSSTRRLRKLGE